MRTGGLLRKVAGIGRMTLEDAADLGSVFAHVAARQARDALTATQRLARRSADDARRAARR